MAKSIRVALVNDYMIVLEGLRALLSPANPGYEVVELDIKTRPKRRSTSHFSTRTERPTPS